MEDYFEINRKSWNMSVESHVKSDLYDMPNFKKGKTSLDELSVNILGNIKGLRVLHLQCHFGQDTLSMARMGAHVTGVDISDVAINKARTIAKQLKIDAEFVCCNVLEVDQHLEGEFDLIFTSYGTIGWLPELTTWAKQIQHFLKPGGRFVMIEFHPVIWMFDDEVKEVTYGYFNTGVILEENEGTYADKVSKQIYKHATWNHTISDVFTALFQARLKLTAFSEYDYSHYQVFPRPVSVPDGYQIGGLEGKLPLTYALEAVHER